VVGLTGGIGAGKSAAADAFAQLGVEVIDADLVSREVVGPGTPGLREIVARFGDGITQGDGTLNRRKLRELVFADPRERQWLETLLHPGIRARIHELVLHSTATWLLLVVPLLLETQAYDFINRVLVVDVPEALQTARVTRRDNISDQEASAIMARQLSRSARLQQADDVLDNSGSLEQLRQRVATLVSHYEELAHDWHQTG